MLWGSRIIGDNSTTNHLLSMWEQLQLQIATNTVQRDTRSHQALFADKSAPTWK